MTEEPERINVAAGWGRKWREVVLEVGKKYIIDPLNPRAKHNRGRRCVILAFVPWSDREDMPTVAKVRYLDNNRVGRQDLDNLVAAEAEQ